MKSNAPFRSIDSAISEIKSYLYEYRTFCDSCLNSYDFSGCSTRLHICKEKKNNILDKAGLLHNYEVYCVVVKDGEVIEVLDTRQTKFDNLTLEEVKKSLVDRNEKLKDARVILTVGIGNAIKVAKSFGYIIKTD